MEKNVNNRIEIYDAPEALAHAAAEAFITASRNAIEAYGLFTVALSGGDTPHDTYRLLGTPEFAGRVEWERVHLFWGDERCVPLNHPDSNYRLVRDTLLDRVPIPAAQVHRIRGELAASQAAVMYEGELRAFLIERDGKIDPSLREQRTFDFVFLGMGTDGHTASLFPGTHALHEEGRWVVTQEPPAPSTISRVTLIPKVINASTEVRLLITGSLKADTVRLALEGPMRPEMLPVQLIAPRHGAMIWMLDREAAARLRQEGSGSHAA